MGSQNIIHAIRSQGWVVECADEHSDHSKCSEQVLNTSGSRARQDLDFTSMYPTNIGGGGLWVKGKRVWSGGGDREKPILGFLLRLFWGKCPTRMTYRPKEVRMSWNHKVHAMKDRKRKNTHIVADKSATTNK